MKWAFWRRKRSTRAVPPSPAGLPEPDFDSGDSDAGEAAARAVRVRSRRRLIGACALLLTAVILVPMVLDPAPRAVPDTIPIDLPSDKTPFAPHLAAPAAEAPPPVNATGSAAIPAAPGAAADTAADLPPAPASRPSAPAAPPAEHGAHGKKHASADGAAPGRLFVQAGAMARESAARELATRIAKSGLTPFVERSDTSDGVRYRVRLGPFASRTEAERSRARLRALGVDANIVGA